MNKYMTFDFEIKAINDDGMCEGYASTFSNIDEGLDIVEPGAFTKTLKENKGKIPVLADHNPFMQIGWGIDAREEEKGLYVAFELDLVHNQKAREKHSLAQKAKKIGARSGLSIGYKPIKAEPHPEKPMVRCLKELKLWEYSMVVFPMNPKSQITVVKSIDGLGIDASLKVFVETLREMHYPESEIKRVLSDYIDQGKPVSQINHSLIESINDLKKALTS